MDTAVAVRGRGITKIFGDVVALDHVDVSVARGQIHGLVGPNGAGKTTLLGLMLGLAVADEGDLEILGAPVGRALPAPDGVSGFVDGPGLYPTLTAKQNLATLVSLRFGEASGAGVAEALELVGLSEVADDKVRGFSLGMRQRLGLAAALIRHPRLLILDEPGNGLDPRGIRDLRELLTGLNSTGVTIVLSSHLLAEVEQLCTRVGVLDAGRLVLQDDLAALRAPTGRILLDTPDADQVAAMLDGQVEHRDGQQLLVRCQNAAALTARMVGAGLRISAIGPQQRTLEEIVLSVTGTGSDHIGGPS
jgi:ABC-2 type transport system ATP-binding protein